MIRKASDRCWRSESQIHALATTSRTCCGVSIPRRLAVLLETLKRPDLDDDARSWLSRVGVEIGVGPEVRSAIDYGTSLPAPSDPIEQLVSHLLFGDGNTRAHALAGLLLLSDAAVKPIFDDAVVEALEEMVAGPDLSVRLDAIRLLGRKGSWYTTYFDFIYYHLPLAEEIEAGGGVRPDWVALVVAALDDPDEDVRIVAINHIAKLQFPAKIDLLESALHDGDHRVTWWAARGLSEILGTGHPAFLSWVRSALSDQDYRARSCAAQALTGPTDPCLVRPLVLYLLTEPLDHRDGPMGSAKTQSTGRWSAARALQRVEAKQAAEVDKALRAAETDDASVVDSEGVASASAGPGSLSGWLHPDWVVRAVDVAAASANAASLLTSGVDAAEVIECTGLGDFVVRFCSTQGSEAEPLPFDPLSPGERCARDRTLCGLCERVTDTTWLEKGAPKLAEVRVLADSIYRDWRPTRQVGSSSRNLASDLSWEWRGKPGKPTATDAMRCAAYVKCQSLSNAFQEQVGWNTFRENVPLPLLESIADTVEAAILWVYLRKQGNTRASLAAEAAVLESVRTLRTGLECEPT